MAANDEHLSDLIDALERAGSKGHGVDVPTLPALLDELSLWLEDDVQWRDARAIHWKSLLQDVARAISAHSGSVLKHVDDADSLELDVKDLVTECGKEESRADVALRQRLRRLVERVQAGLATMSAVKEGWTHLRETSAAAPDGEAAARRMLALAGWFGHDEERFRKGLMNDLSGLGQDEPGDAATRLARAEARVTRDPHEADCVVWLRLLFAEVPGPPTINLGAVTIYRGNWLREQLELGAPDIVPEAKIGSPFGFDALDDFCGVGRRKEDEDEDEDAEMSIAYARVELGRILQADALAAARRTISAVASLGALDGAEPTLWQIDPSFLTFAEGRYGSMSFIASNVGSPSIRERTGMVQDPTASTLREDRERLIPHLPIAGGEMADVAELLEWLRDARRSPPSARLVLCDRAIERCAKRGGIASPRRFVESFLIPNWAYMRVRSELLTLANRVRFDSHRHYADGSPERLAYQQILEDNEIALQELPDGRYSVNTAGLIRRLDWIGARVEPGGEASRSISDLGPRLRTGKATAAWLNDICEVARGHEARRSRTRNALMHGGPVALATVEQVLPFAERMAAQALGALVDAGLDGTPFVDAVIEQTENIRRARRRLKNNERPDVALFW